MSIGELTQQGSATPEAVRVFLVGLDSGNDEGKLIFLSKEQDLPNPGNYKTTMEALINDLKTEFSQGQRTPADFTFKRKTRICFCIDIKNWEFEGDGFDFKSGVTNDSFFDLKRESGPGRFETLSLLDDLVINPGQTKEYPFNLLIETATNIPNNSKPLSIVVDPAIKNEG